MPVYSSRVSETAARLIGQTNMPSQEEHDKPENLVDQTGQAAHAARTLGEAADSNNTLDGYYAVNNSRADANENAESTKPGGGSSPADKSTPE